MVVSTVKLINYLPINNKAMLFEFQDLLRNAALTRLEEMASQLFLSPPGIFLLSPSVEIT